MSKPTMSELMKFTTDEEIDAFIKLHAHTFTVVEMKLGGFVNGSRNYIHHEAKTIEDARDRAKEIHDRDPKKPGIIIYAIADIGYVKNMSRPVESYPYKKPYMSKAAQAKLEREQKRQQRTTKSR